MSQRIFKNHQQIAVAYAVQKLIESQLKNEDELPPGLNMDISGMTLEIKIPEGTRVERAEGAEGDGVRPTMATTNMYGWAVLTVVYEILEKFKHHNTIMNQIIAAVDDAVTTVGGTTEKELLEARPELEKMMEALKKRVGRQLPKRDENTRRYVKRETKQAPAITISRRLAKAA